VTAGLKTGAKFAFAVVLMVLVWRMVDGAEVAARLRALRPGWVVVAVVLLLVQTVLSALRWRLTAARLGHEMGLRRALREYFLAQVVNLALPGGVLGDAGRAVRAGVVAGLERAGQAVVFERLAGQAALVAVVLMAALVVSIAPGGIVLPGAILAGLGVVAAVLLMAGGLVVLAGAGWPRVAGWRAAAAQAVFAREVWPQQLALSLGTVAANLLAFAACAAAVGVWLPLGAVLVILPLVLFTMLVPLTIGGWGLREGAAVVLFPMAGATAAEGFAASASFGVVFLLTSVLGMALWLWPGRAEPGRQQG
jgi:glycosyltransferase 2 family protein